MEEPGVKAVRSTVIGWKHLLYEPLYLLERLCMLFVLATFPQRRLWSSHCFDALSYQGV